MAELHTTHPRGGLYIKDFEVGRVFRRRLTRTASQTDDLPFSSLTRRRAFQQDGMLVVERRRAAFVRRRPPATTAV